MAGFHIGLSKARSPYIAPATARGIAAMTVIVTLGPGHFATHLVARACAVMLFVLATVSSFTGARTGVLPMRICPIAKSAAAILFVAGTLV